MFFNMLNRYSSSSLELTTSSFDSECENWKQNHVFFAKDLHYFNKTFAFVKIASLNDFNITNQCPPKEYNINSLKIFAKKGILFNNDLNLRGLMNIFNRTDFPLDVLFENINGFNENSNAEERKAISASMIQSIQMSNVIFDFYRQNKLLSSQNCSDENFDSKTSFFGPIKALFLIKNVFYNNQICPYVFMNTKLEQLFLIEISNSLIFKNRVEFLNINKTKDLDLNVKSLVFVIFTMYCDSITITNLNPFLFKTLEFLIIKGNLEYIDEHLFENFHEISYIAIRSDVLKNFFHRGTKWINSLNKNLNVSLNVQFQFKHNIQRLVSIEFDVINWFLFNKYYTFPNEDICLFKDFPHSQLVLPLIVFNPLKFNNEEECSCTMIWLVQNYRYYIYDDFKKFNSYVRFLDEYKDYFENVTIRNCIRNEEYLKERFYLCNFSRLFENCDLITFKIEILGGIQSFTLLLKWFQYIVEVYIRTILCSLGLITNLFTLKLIHNKNHSKNFQNSMYKHMSTNAFFNILFCLIYILTLMNSCVTSKSSFCSSIWRTEFSQYFHIYVILFLGNALRLCCNISYIFFSVSRFALCSMSNENKLRKFFEKQNIKRFYIILIILTLGFSLFFVSENYVNILFQEYNEANFKNNAYDVGYCEHFHIPIDSENFILTPVFYFKCKLFKWLNILNNILNNVLFLFISICVDICMIRYSNKIIKEKKAINCPNLADAINFKNKLNKMIITNGTLYFFSHIPEFVVTLILSFYNSIDFVQFCADAFDCSILIDMAQTFHFISIGFQFFVFLIFDHNFKNSFGEFLHGKK